MGVRWTRAAQRQLREIVDYIARDSPKAAAGLAGRIGLLCEKIADQPLSGQIVPEFKDTVIRERRVASYRILYSVASPTPKILAIHHQRRLLTEAAPDQDRRPPEEA